MHKESEIDICDKWPMLTKDELILRGDMAFELGGDTYEAVSGLAFTTNKSIVPQSFVKVIGPDIKDIKADCSYARITLIRLSDNRLNASDDALYRVMRKVDFVRFHIHPKGYMMSIRSSQRLKQ